ncbi:MAG: radical SAM protein [Planctomycetia bacterium]|nr:MAG: radical SAM protein [Planctomycetia bacterium]
MDRLRINEVFHSVQGEGTRAGLPCAFIRLTGCHLRCRWCDTEYAFYEGGWRTIDDLLAEVRRFGCPLVQVTGGEPLLQPAVYPLMSRLCDEFATVMLETSGALPIERVDPRVVCIVDVKCPGSGEESRNHWDNLRVLRPHDEVKFVIADRADYDYAVTVIRRHNLGERCAAVLLNPVFGELEPVRLAEWMLADGLPARLGLQLHKLIWSPTARGV